MLAGEREAPSAGRLFFPAPGRRLEPRAITTCATKPIGLMADELTLRKFLGGFNFRDRVHELPSAFCGEKARLALALVAFLKPNILLFMNQPTVRHGNASHLLMR